MMLMINHDYPQLSNISTFSLTINPERTNIVIHQSDFIVENIYKHSKLTSLIIKAFFKVYNSLGYGFLEKVYQNAMMIELQKMGLNCSCSLPVNVYYEGYKVGYYVADILVEKSVIAELKTASTLCLEDEAQLLNYLKGTDIEVGLLLNFGPKPQFKRKLFSEEFKSPRSYRNSSENLRPPNQ